MDERTATSRQLLKLTLYWLHEAITERRGTAQDIIPKIILVSSLYYDSFQDVPGTTAVRHAAELVMEEFLRQHKAGQLEITPDLETQIVHLIEMAFQHIQQLQALPEYLTRFKKAYNMASSLKNAMSPTTT